MKILFMNSRIVHNVFGTYQTGNEGKDQSDGTRNLRSVWSDGNK